MHPDCPPSNLLSSTLLTEFFPSRSSRRKACGECKTYRAGKNTTTRGGSRLSVIVAFVEQAETRLDSRFGRSRGTADFFGSCG
jgi:hypothetical protein